MAEHRYMPWIAICIIVILACQTCSIAAHRNLAAHRNQETKWVTKHLSQPRGERVLTRTARHLQESRTQSRRGYWATLVDETHVLHNRLGLTPFERVFQRSENSWTRAYYLDSRARAAPYFGDTSSTGRKLLQAPAEAPSSFESTVDPAPGGYSMKFSIGTPPQHFVAIADTGSDLVWLQCQACTVCFQQAGRDFQPQSSSTYSTQGCTPACNLLGGNEAQCSPTCLYTYSYGDQTSTKGDFSTDTVVLEDYDTTATTLIPNFNFGCGLQNNGSFAGVDGLVGLGRGPISFPSQVAPYLDNKSIFTYCLVDVDAAVPGSSAIVFGEDALPTNSTGLDYTPLLTPYNVSEIPYYYVSMTGISVGSVNLSIPASAFQTDSNGNGGTIFDSGTTITQLVSKAYKPLMTELETQITQYPVVDLFQETGLDLCFNITGQTSVTIPSVVFFFENAELVLSFDNIMTLVSTTSGGESFMCLAMMSSPGMSIIGNTQQTDFQIVYDLDALKIGWRTEDCSTFMD